jgi:hypothetical protein
MLLTGVTAGLGVVALVQTLLLWRASRALGRLHVVESRVEKFGDALTLLTDTTESAFRMVASEINRTPAVRAVSRASAARTAKIARAARRGTSVTEIAAAEEMAEGEVRLRLHLANEKTAPKANAKPREARGPREVRTKTNGTKREVTRGAVQLG